MDLSMMSRGRGIHQSDCLDPVKRKNWTFACTAPHGNPTTRKLRFRRSILLEQVVMMVTRETVLRENRFGASNSIYACICLACVFPACMEDAGVCTIIRYICLQALHCIASTYFILRSNNPLSNPLACIPATSRPRYVNRSQLHRLSQRIYPSAKLATNYTPIDYRKVYAVYHISNICHWMM